MKKKVAYITEKEILNICEKHQTSFTECNIKCPLYRVKKNHLRLCNTVDTYKSCKEELKKYKEINNNPKISEIINFYENKLQKLKEDMQIEVEVEE